MYLLYAQQNPWCEVNSTVGIKSEQVWTDLPEHFMLPQYHTGLGRYKFQSTVLGALFDYM